MYIVPYEIVCEVIHSYLVPSVLGKAKMVKLKEIGLFLGGDFNIFPY